MEVKKLKIFSSKNWVMPGKNTVVVLWPFWPAKELESSDPDFGRFAEYISKGKEIIELVETIEESDVAMYPQEYTFSKEGHEHLRRVAEEAGSKGKELIVYYNSDDDSTISIDNCIVFRTSFYQSSKKKYEFAFPGWSVDFLNYFPNKTFTALEAGQPTVSYCGYVDYESRNVKQLLRSVVKPPAKNWENRAKAIRGKACRVLKKNSAVKTNFIIRNGFWAAGVADKNEARKEYANNMIGSLYGICTRGGGNFSYRFYEILSCGRIPLFINTNAVLPYDTLIDWKKHVVWVEETELDAIDEILLKFHSGKTAEELKQIQINNRKLYEEYISPFGFHSKLGSFLNYKKQ